MDRLKLGSLFDGSGGFPLGGLLAGITPVWASEIEPFPIRVTTKRLPRMRHLGDVSSINGADIEPVDIITFGSHRRQAGRSGGGAVLPFLPGHPHHQGNEVCNQWKIPTLDLLGERRRGLQLKPGPRL